MGNALEQNPESAPELCRLWPGVSRSRPVSAGHGRADRDPFRGRPLPGAGEWLFSLVMAGVGFEPT